MTDIPSASASIPSRLGVTARVDDGELVLRVTPRPETCRLGAVRASVLAFAADAVGGVAVDRDLELWTFTSDLSLRVDAVPAPAWIDASTRVLREGKRSATCEVRMVDDRGRQVAYSALGFSRVGRRPGDPEKLQFRPAEAARSWGLVEPIDEPLRDAAGVRVVDGPAGVVELAITDDLRNPAGALQGAMVALVAEAAAEDLLSARLGEPALVTELEIRYLAQARIGPIRTRSELLGPQPGAPVLVELVDVTDGRLLTHVVARGTRAP